MDNYSRIESKKNRTTPALKVLKRASKSYEALQQGLILSLLNTHNYGIVFIKPDRRSIKTIQSLAVKALVLPNGFVFEFDKELEKHCNRLADEELRQAKYYALTAHNIESIAEINKIVDDGYDIEKLKQIKRHREANRNSIAFNWLVKYAEDIGYKFGKRQSKPAQFTTKMLKITSVLGEDDKVEINQDVIEYIGIKFNQYVFEKFEKDKNELTVFGNDEFIYNLVNNHEEVKGTYLKSLYEEELNEANALSVNTYQMSQNNNTITTYNDMNENMEMNQLNESNNLNTLNNSNVMNEYINQMNNISNMNDIDEIKENENESNIQAKTVTVIQPETNNLNQSVDIGMNNETNNDINIENDAMSQNTMYNQLPSIAMTQIDQNEYNNENEMNQEIPIDNQSTTTQSREYSMEQEMLRRYIQEYYDNVSFGENFCNSFIQCYNF